MAYIELVDEENATGALADEYDRARARAGKVFNIIKTMSLAPNQLRHSIDLYLQIMFGDSPLTRRQREAIAVLVSKVNECHY